MLDRTDVFMLYLTEPRVVIIRVTHFESVGHVMSRFLHQLNATTRLKL